MDEYTPVVVFSSANSFAFSACVLAGTLFLGACFDSVGGTLSASFGVRICVARECTARSIFCVARVRGLGERSKGRCVSTVSMRKAAGCCVLLTEDTSWRAWVVSGGGGLSLAWR